MGFRRGVWLLSALAALITGLFAFQRPFRQFPGVEYEDFPLPPDCQEKTEWTFARLMYPAIAGWGWGYRANRDWRKGDPTGPSITPARTATSPAPCAASPAFTPAPSSSPSTWTTATTSTIGRGFTPSRWATGT